MRDLARLLGLRPRRLVAPVALGAASVLASAALVGLSAYLICRASQQPPILSLTMLIVAVRAVALVRPLARYAERLSAHDLAFRTLGDVRTAVFARIEPLAPEGLEHYRDGDLLSRMVADVDEMQDLVLRVVVPVAVAVPTGGRAGGRDRRGRAGGRGRPGRRPGGAAPSSPRGSPTG